MTGEVRFNPIHVLPQAKKPADPKSAWEKLAQDLILEIIGYDLSLRDISSFSLSCKQLHQLVQSDSLWRTLFLARFPNCIPQPGAAYLEMYKYEHHRICYNRANGVYATQVLAEHRDDILATALVDHTLISASKDKTIKLWDLKTKKCIGILLGHKKSVGCLATLGDRVFSGSADHTIKIWDLKTRECLRTLNGHTTEIGSLIAHEGRLFSGSNDALIHVWDLETSARIKTFKGHTDEVCSLIIVGNRLFSGSGDCTIKVWDLQSLNCLATLKGHHSGINAFAVIGDTLISGSYDRTICFWNTTTYVLEKTLLTEHDLGVFSLAVTEDWILSGSDDDRIKIWDIKTGLCLATLNGHESGITSIVMKGDRIFSSSFDKTIRIWDFAAQETEVLREIALLFTTRYREDFADAMHRFSILPDRTKSGVYQELKLLLISSLETYSGSAKDAFHDENEERSKPSQKAKAIENYLIKNQ